MKEIIKHIAYECPICHKIFEERAKAEKCIHYPIEDFKIIGGDYIAGGVLPGVLTVKAPNGLSYKYKIEI